MHIATLFDRSFLVECLALCQRATAVRQPLYLCTLSAFLLIVSSCHSCSSIAETNANHSIGGWGRSQLDYLSSIEENGKNHHPLTYSLSLFSLPNKNVDVKLSIFLCGPVRLLLCEMAQTSFFLQVMHAKGNKLNPPRIQIALVFFRTMCSTRPTYWFQY